MVSIVSFHHALSAPSWLAKEAYTINRWKLDDNFSPDNNRYRACAGVLP